MQLLKRLFAEIPSMYKSHPHFIGSCAIHFSICNGTKIINKLTISEIFQERFYEVRKSF